ncbi:MAG TPA: hypothetical protein VHW23_01360 [Kofleriaceae bacterium]|nr:hypothetical protein [Kofleriaceae bacterium]
MTLVRVILFRFAFVYWISSVFVLAANEDTGITLLGKVVAPVWNPIVVWVGKHVLGISYELHTAVNGSGDKTSDWVGVLLAATTAVVATAVWSIIDRRGTRDARLRPVLRVIVRYTLAFALLGYGSSKLLCLQFAAPTAARLTQPYGESSPMGLLWTFMGASPLYQFFAGAAETIGALLLLFRRTTALGAFTLAVVLVNVVLLNLCYDVPVKINSMHYLGMCIFLLLPTLHRLADVLVFNRATLPEASAAISSTRRLRIAGAVIKYALIGVMVFQDVQTNIHWLRALDARTWYSDYWNVTKFVQDGQEVPALVTDTTRWQRIRFQIGIDHAYARWRYTNGSYGDLYTVVIDEVRQLMTFTRTDPDKLEPASGSLTLRYVRTDPDHLTLDGKVGAATLSVQVERLVVDQMLLVRRGFHWINEAPFNR